MVGNEIANDILPAQRAGMKTFFATKDGNAPPDIPADWSGTLRDFGRLMERGKIKAVHLPTEKIML